MFYPEPDDQGSSQIPPARFPKPEPRQERVRHLLTGSLAGIERAIKILHALGYAEPNDWSDPIPMPPSGAVGSGDWPRQPAASPGEIVPGQWMVIMTKILLME